MRIWCIPKSTSLESPCLPPRIDRDVFIRSPPPPPRLSKQEKLARGVIVYKTRRNKSDKNAKPPPHANSKTSSVKTSSVKSSTSKSSGRPIRKVRYADLADEEPHPPPRVPQLPVIEAAAPPPPQVQVPHRGEIVHCRQQSNTSGTSSSGHGTGSSSLTSPASIEASPHYSSSSGRGSSAEAAPSPSPSLNNCDNCDTRFGLEQTLKTLAFSPAAIQYLLLLKVFLSISISKFTQLLLDLAPEHPDQPDLVPEQAIRQELEIKQAEGQEDGDQVHAEPQCGRLHQAADGAEKVS